MTGTRVFSRFLAFKQGYVFLSNSTCHKVFEEKNFFFWKFSLFFCVAMKFVRNLLMSSSKCGDGEGDVPLKAQMAYIFKICQTFLSKKTSHRSSKLKKLAYGRKIQKTMSNPESLLILCYHGSLITMFPFRLETFLARER